MKLTKEKIETAKEIYKDLKKWNLANEIISKFFKNNPINQDFDIVLIKVLLIDSLYKTNLKDQISVAKHIFSKIIDLDKGLNRGDINIVDSVAKWVNPSKKKIHYLLSFASKFCHFHNKKAYPIYDMYVIIALKSFLPSWEDKRTFSNFFEAISLIKKESILNASFEDLDKFLWLYGLLLNLEKGKEDINKEILSYYQSHKDTFEKLK